MMGPPPQPVPNQRRGDVQTVARALPNREKGTTVNTDRIRYLRGELEAERISYGQLAEIEDAFDALGLNDIPEGILAGDQLDEIERRAENVAHHWPSD